jgi:hypothetical protein
MAEAGIEGLNKFYIFILEKIVKKFYLIGM